MLENMQIFWGYFCFAKYIKMNSQPVAQFKFPSEAGDFRKSWLNRWIKCFKGITLCNKSFVANWSVNFVKLVDCWIQLCLINLLNLIY